MIRRRRLKIRSLALNERFSMHLSPLVSVYQCPFCYKWQPRAIKKGKVCRKCYNSYQRLLAKQSQLRATLLNTNIKLLTVSV